MTVLAEAEPRVITQIVRPEPVEGLPASWTRVPIQDIAAINPRGPKPECDSDSLVHFVPMSAVVEEFGGINVSTLRPLREVQKGYTSFVGNDVLLAKITPCMENGKAALVPHLSNAIGFGSTEFHVLRGERGIDPRWLAQFVSQAEFRRLARQNMTGSAGQMRVPTNWLSVTGIPLAPAAEQTRIVEKLEELLSDLDAGVAELKAAQKKLTQYRQSLLKAAVEGALTAEWRAQRSVPPPSRGRLGGGWGSVDAQETHPHPNPPLEGEGTCESGAQLLARILKERRARWQAKQLAKFADLGKAPPKDWQDKYPEPVKPDTTDLPSLPEGWVWASVEELAVLVSGHTPKDAELSADANGDVPWFKVGDMNREGNEEWLSFAAVKFTESAASELGMKIAPRGTIVFPKRGGAIATNKKRRLSAASCYDLNTMGLVPVPSISDWLWRWFMTIDLGRLSDGSNVPQINNPDIAPLCVPIPPFAEQVEIMVAMDAGLAGIQLQETMIDRLLRQSTAQRKNILKAAFSGQLVPQDPSDEPASVLLARIRAERAGLALKPRVGRRKAALADVI